MAAKHDSADHMQMDDRDSIITNEQAISIESDTQETQLIKQNTTFSPYSQAIRKKRKPIEDEISKRRKDGVVATELHVAASKADIREANTLLNSPRTDPNVIDEEKRTALHRLCLVQSDKRVTEFFNLIKDKVRDFDEQDIWKCTPLHYAAKNGHLKVMELLLQKGVRINPTDWCSATPFHLAASTGQASVVSFLLDKNVDLARRDIDGCTPVHYAARKGHTQVLKKIIERFPECAGQLCTKGMTILHWAVQSGNPETVKYVVTQTPVDVNAKDGCDLTPLHHNASNGCVEIAKLLIRKGADVNIGSPRGSVFHIAVKYGHMKLVFSLLENGANGNEDFRDIVNEGYEDAAKAVIGSDRWPFALRGQYKNGKGKETTAFRELIVKMPVVAKMVLDRCTVEGQSEDQDRKFTVAYNYEFIEDFVDNAQENDKEDTVVSTSPKDSPDTPDSLSVMNDCSYEELTKRKQYLPRSRFRKSDHPLEIMVKNKRLDLLTHPVVGSLLHYKWKKFGLIGYIINLLYFILFLGFLTAFALFVPKPQSSLCRNITMLNVFPEQANKLCPDIGLRVFLIFASAVVILMAFIRLLFEVIQLAAQRLSYFTDWINWVEIILYVCSIIFVSVYGMDCFCVADWQWQVGVVAVFLGWINLIVFFSKFPVLGIYVIILIKISKTLLKMVMLSILLIVSFGLTFFMIFFDASVLRSPFANVPRSLLKVVTMTTGELGFDAIFRQDPSGSSDNAIELTFLPISSILWIVFIILMPVILINMMTGLAVGDTVAVLKEAQLQKLALQVDQTLSTEELVVTLQRFCGRCRPKSWGKIKLYRKVHPNQKIDPPSLAEKLFSPLKILFCQKLNETERQWIHQLSFLLWEGDHYDDIQVLTQTLTASKRVNIMERKVTEKKVEEVLQLIMNKLGMNDPEQ